MTKQLENVCICWIIMKKIFWSIPETLPPPPRDFKTGGPLSVMPTGNEHAIVSYDGGSHCDQGQRACPMTSGISVGGRWTSCAPSELRRCTRRTRDRNFRPHFLSLPVRGQKEGNCSPFNITCPSAAVL